LDNTVLVRKKPDVSEEHITPIFRVEEYAQQETVGQVSSSELWHREIWLVVINLSGEYATSVIKAEGEAATIPL
jgi:hypothetical protein